MKRTREEERAYRRNLYQRRKAEEPFRQAAVFEAYLDDVKQMPPPVPAKVHPPNHTTDFSCCRDAVV